VEPLRAKCGWIVALGVIYVVAGLIALSSVVLATVVSVFIVGIMMVVAAWPRSSTHSSSSPGASSSSGSCLVCSTRRRHHDVRESAARRGAVDAYAWGRAGASGIMRIILAFSMKEGMPWMWVVLSGVITLLLGGIILAKWRSRAFTFSGCFLGIDLVFAGVGWIFVGLGLKSRA